VTGLRRALAAAAAVLLLSAGASAADTARPLRTLVFDVTYNARATRAVKTSGMAPNARGAGTHNLAGTGTAEQQADGTDRGKLTVDVVAATGEGALVVDAAFDGTVAQPPVRVVVFSDGRLSWNPAHPLSPAGLRVLPLLARGLLTDKDVSPGSSWTVPAAPPQKGERTYRVRHVEGNRATIEIEGTRSMSGSDEYEHANAVYATDMLTPLSLAVDARIRRQIGIDDSLTTDAHLVATLVSDTFAKK
jgi:hypothetical protein